MTDYTELALSDGTSIRLEVAAGPPAEGGITGVSPVSGASTAATRTTRAARAVLRPLGPLLQEVHEAVSAGAVPPDEISVQFGVQVGQDLKLGIVGANGHASLTISATWRPSAAAQGSAAAHGARTAADAGRRD
ncbi:CU044_2847 family protein [Streptomyces palmae]|uniref:CU044_2847 family protein n=1 Tax=Streptomyces palmae TaxID=1701085 RepID=UPI0035E7E103